MNCPACGAKYPRGTERCRKCSVLLVEESGKSASRPESDAAPSLLWSGADAIFFSALTHSLAAAEIPFHESVVHDWAGGAFLKFPLRAAGSPGFEVRVAQGDFGAATNIVEALIISAEGDLPDDFELDQPPDQAASRLQWKWGPDEPIVEVWSGEDVDWADYLCDALRENRIPSQCTHEEGKPERILVRGSDADAARHVLKEIEHSSSPSEDAE